MQVKAFFVVSDDHFFFTIESFAFTQHLVGIGRFSSLRNIVQAQYHVLGRKGDWRTVLRVQDVVRSKHQQLRSQDSGMAQRNVNRHLVTVKVGVEGRGNQR